MENGKPPDLLKYRKMDFDRLAKMEHAGWLADFANVLKLNTRVEDTPMRQGTITRLEWAASFITQLVDRLEQSKQRVALLEQELRDLRKNYTSNDNVPDEPEGR